jgi:transcriptional antiterminator Rof (Rho-off)
MYCNCSPGTKTMSDYSPVSCEAHSLYELAVMQGKSVLVRWQDSEGVNEMYLLPIDVETKNREEFLLARDSENVTLRIRLDRILSFQPESQPGL